MSENTEELLLLSWDSFQFICDYLFQRKEAIEMFSPMAIVTLRGSYQLNLLAFI